MPDERQPAAAPDRPAGTAVPVRSTVASFGRSLHATTTLRPVDETALPRTRGIARGSGCSYGDQAWCSGGVSWTAPTGIHLFEDSVEVGGGVVLRDLLALLWPLGRSLPVLPGSLSVTVGGAIAADVHGKNHPVAGSFGLHVRSLDLATPTGRRRLVPGDPAFDATTGGLGLTGTILRAVVATVAQPSRSVRHTTLPATGAEAMLAAFRRAAADHQHVAAWVDLAGPTTRGIVEATTPVDDDDAVGTTGRWPVESRGGIGAHRPDRPTAARVHVPRLPVSVITRQGVRVGNALRYAGTRPRSRIVPRATALFPLDAVEGFANLYGPAGFVQHQVLVPDGRDDLLVDLFATYRALPVVPALAVLKRLGPGGSGHLSFPSPGWTLAVDLPAGRPELGARLDAIDRRIAAAGGRLYLAKDATADPDVVAEMLPRLESWRDVADDLDPDHLVTSDLDRRLGLRRALRRAGSTRPPRAGTGEVTTTADDHGTPAGRDVDA